MTRLPRTPALDGLRGLAVVAVLLFHAGAGWAVGGHLGVTVFFALSGFLITSLLLSEHESTGSIDLRAFWGRRAKRLVPALTIALTLAAAVAAWTPHPAEGLLPDAVATLSWTANWWFVHAGQSYADLFHDPSPLQHTWSLAVEEQYYLVFPLLMLLVIPRGRRAVGVSLAALLALSLVVGSWLSLHGAQSTRLHFGTDVRVAEILVGAGLAVLLQRPGGWRAVPGLAVPALGLLAAVFLIASEATVQDDSRYLQRGGWALTALATCFVLAAAVQPDGVVVRVLSTPPLVWTGQVSYGAYLYHWPLYLLLTTASTGLDGLGLLLLRLGAVLLLSDLSLRLVERPVRETRFSPAGAVGSWAFAGTAGLVAVGFGTGAIVLPSLPSPAPITAPVQAAQPVPQQPVQQPARRPGRTAPLPRALSAQHPQPLAPAPRKQAVPAAFAEDPDQVPVPPVPEAGPNQLRVAVVGDSLADNLASGLDEWAGTRTDVVVYDLALPGCPLSRGGERRFTGDRPFPVKRVCGWWADASSERWQALSQFAPQVVVAEDGVNELFDRRLPSWSDWHAPGDQTLDDWLVGQYEEAFGGFGGSVLLLNTPCADWQRYWTFAAVTDMDGRVAAVNADQTRVPDVTRGDLRQRICPGGQYSDTVEGQPNGRPDGLHLSQEASYALARNWLGPLVLVTRQSSGLLGSPTG